MKTPVKSVNWIQLNCLQTQSRLEETAPYVDQLQIRKKYIPLSKAMPFDNFFLQKVKARINKLFFKFTFIFNKLIHYKHYLIYINVTACTTGEVLYSNEDNKKQFTV